MPNNVTKSIVIDDSGNKWIGTSGGGLLKFDDTNWTPYTSSNSGMPSNDVYSIAIDGSGNKWIGTFNTGIAVFKEGGLVLATDEAQKNGSQKTIGLVQNYPNPFNTITTIKYRVADPGFVSLKVFDIMGDEVTSLVNEQKHKGDYAEEWNAAGQKSGIYFSRLQNGNSVTMKKMMLMK
jgi:hypothetical protein